MSADPRELVDGREAHEHGREGLRIRQDACGGVAIQRVVEAEVAVGSRAAGVNDALGDPLVVEVRDLLAKVEVFEE